MSKKVLRIIVPLIMLIGIGGIYVSGNLSEKSEVSQSAETGANENNAFALNVSSVDTAAMKEVQLPIIIDFGADSCVPCIEMAPVLVKVNEEMQNKALIKFVDVWKHPNAANGFPIQVIPTQVFFDGEGKAYNPSEELIASALIKFTKYADKTSGEHLFTVHQGGLTEEEMRAILKDMGVE